MTSEDIALVQKDFTADVKSAWIKTYGVLSQTMRAACVAPPPDRLN